MSTKSNVVAEVAASRSRPADQALPQASGAVAGINRAARGASPSIVPISLPAPLQQRPAQSEPIMHFIELEIEARRCSDLDGLRFAMVNSSRKIAGFDQAFLVEPRSGGDWAITRGSGVSMVEQSAPLVRTIGQWLAHPRHAETLSRGEPRQVNIVEEMADWGLALEPHQIPLAYWLPVKSRDGHVIAGLLMLRKEAWQPHHLTLIIPLSGAYAHAWEALLPRANVGMSGARHLFARSRLSIVAGLLLGLAAIVPVPMSALAPSEVVAAEPLLVTAPIDGVVGDVLVAPGTWVEKDTPIIRFVDVKLRNDHEVAIRNVAVAEARHFKIVQSATATQKDMQDLATTKAELDVAKAELAYAAELLARSEVRAQTAGLLIYSSKSDLVGKPVSIGERLMEIGNPNTPEIRIELPVSDAIVLRAGGGVALFLDGDPLRAIPGTISRTSYRPALSAEQQLVYRVNARFNDQVPHRIGLRGVARVSGDQVTLWFYLLRRPIAALRQRIGL